ncbi:Protein phosphatase 1 regulatory subunit 36 [Galemys pyrenaicus]|uniref:Protein phosphatase 1 regulatory subunit 36 n=1 Tax=Galemys pyrenaicus TaxID=202257 RepID=A0A8J6DL70_GALPY|nr:Protein phosphatase 1 regulatory subunit 36 [Galemys pyrenaicus]
MYRVPELYTSRRTRVNRQANPQADHLGLRLGIWYWKDETKTLEFRSFTPAIEPKEKGKKGKAVHFAEIDGPASERLTDKRYASREDKSLKASEKRGQQGNVTLHDAKFVALLLLQDAEMQKICSFTTFMRGLVEKKEMELVLSKLEAAQKYLAQKYCILVLGLGMPDKHHMCCGKIIGLREKISDTQKDWKFFESFYTFCTYVAWIVFRRQHFIEIEEEIGRLFRTNLFNIPRRKREEEESGGEKKRMTFAQFRRMMAKRPAIKKAINMRSPVMSTLLPSFREKAQNVFEKRGHQTGIKLSGEIRKPQDELDSVPMPIVGILGEPRCLFNPHTLIPYDPEENLPQSGRNSSLIERNNMKIQDTLDMAMRTFCSQTTFLKVPFMSPSQQMGCRVRSSVLSSMLNGPLSSTPHPQRLLSFVHSNSRTSSPRGLHKCVEEGTGTCPHEHGASVPSCLSLWVLTAGAGVVWFRNTRRLPNAHSANIFGYYFGHRDFLRQLLTSNSRKCQENYQRMAGLNDQNLLTSHTELACEEAGQQWRGLLCIGLCGHITCGFDRVDAEGAWERGCEEHVPDCGHLEYVWACLSVHT